MSEQPTYLIDITLSTFVPPPVEPPSAVPPLLKIIESFFNDIYVYEINADGTITFEDSFPNNRSISYVPTISSEGNWLIYALSNGSGNDFALRLINGGDLGAEIIPTSSSDLDWAQAAVWVEFAKHDDRLVFMSGQDFPTNYAAIYQLSSDGSELTLLDDAGVFNVEYCDWNEDGTKLVFNSDNKNDNQIYSWNGSVLTQLGNFNNSEIERPSFVPGRIDIVLGIVGSNVNLYDISGNSFSLLGSLTTATGPLNQHPERLRFSPNGEYVLIGRSVIQVTGSAPFEAATLPPDKQGYDWISDSRILTIDESLATHVFNVFDFDGSTSTLVATTDSESTGVRLGAEIVEVPREPKIISILPDQGPDTGNTSVTITVSGFVTTAGAIVLFDDGSASNIVSVDKTTITCNNPPGTPGNVDVEVTVGQLSAIAIDGFTLTAPPSLDIVSISPSSGSNAGGTSVTLTGTFDTGGSVVTDVKFGDGSGTSITVVNATTITCDTPENRVYAVIDSTKIGANLTVTGDLVVTTDGGNSVNQSALSQMGKDSGKWYAEFEVTSLGATGGAGITDIGQSFGSEYVGETSGGYGNWNDGIYNNGSLDDSSKTFVQGDVIMVAYDADNKELWFGNKGTWYDSGDPAAGTGAGYTGLTGTKVLAVSPWDAATQITMRTSSDDFEYTVPSGFTGWSELQTGDVDVVVDQDGDTATLTDGYEYTAPAWTPADLPSGIWLDGSNNATLIDDEPDGDIDTWEDTNGNHDATRVRGGPTHDSVNGLVSFPSNATFELPDINYTEITVVAVMQAGASSGGDEQPISNQPFSGSGVTLNMRYTGGNLRLISVHGGDANDITFNGVRGNKHIVSFRADASGLTTLINGGNEQTDTTGTGATSKGATNIQIGSQQGGRTFNGDMWQVFISFSSISDADLRKLEGYMAHEEGLTAELPASHPYKSSRP